MTKQAIAAAVAAVNKALGADSVLTGAQLADIKIQRITSGSLALDVALGGGWPANQWHEVFGMESAGKTAIVLKTIAANQAVDKDFTTAWIAAEEFVPSYAEMLGCDVSRIYVVDTNVMEDAYQAVIEFLGSKAFDCIVVDSLPALVPTEEDDKIMEAFTVGAGARITNKFFRKQRAATGRTLGRSDRPVTGFMINQFREKVGVMYGDNRTTPGGLGKNFAYFVRLEVKRDEWIEYGKGETKSKVGQVIKATTVKNKSYPPRQVATLDYYFADGPGDLHAGAFDTLKDVVNLAIRYEVVTRAGAYYRFNGEQWQGREGLVQALREEPDMCSAIEVDVMRIAMAGKEPVTSMVTTDAEEQSPKRSTVKAGSRKVPARKPKG